DVAGAGAGDHVVDRAALAGADPHGAAAAGAACVRPRRSRLRRAPLGGGAVWGDVPRAYRQVLAADGQRLADGGERNAKERADHRRHVRPRPASDLRPADAVDAVLGADRADGTDASRRARAPGADEPEGAKRRASSAQAARGAL